MVLPIRQITSEKRHLRPYIGHKKSFFFVFSSFKSAAPIGSKKIKSEKKAPIENPHKGLAKKFGWWSISGL